MILKIPWFINPCRKCIVSSCCTSVCNLYTKRVNQTQQFSRVLSWGFTPIEILIDVYKDKDWFLLCIMIFSYIGVIIQVINVVVLIQSQGG